MKPVKKAPAQGVPFDEERAWQDGAWCRNEDCPRLDMHPPHPVVPTSNRGRAPKKCPQCFASLVPPEIAARVAAVKARLTDQRELQRWTVCRKRIEKGAWLSGAARRWLYAFERDRAWLRTYLRQRVVACGACGWSRARLVAQPAVTTACPNCTGDATCAICEGRGQVPAFTVDETGGEG